jgi:hypothetical protein
MKKSLKNLAILFVCSLSISATAQDLISKISDQASFVLEVNGENSFKDVSILEVENSLLFREIMDEFFGHSSMMKPSSFADMGINVNSKMYLASEKQTDMTYFYYSSTIKDLTKFNDFVKTAMNKDNNDGISTVNGLNQVVNDSKTRLVWNDAYFIFITSTYNGQKYKEDYYSSWREDDFETEVTTESTDSEPTLEDILKEVVEAAEATDVVEESSEVYEDAYYESDYDKRKRLQKAAFERNEDLKEKKKAIFIDSALTARINLYFTDNLTNKFTATGFDNSAVASIWYNSMDLANLYSSLIYGGRYNNYDNPIDFLGLNNYYNAGYSINLFLEEDRISMKSNLEFSENLKESTDKIYNSKLNKNFCKYLPENSLAYSSFSMNTEELLKETATITKDYFETASNFEYSEEVSVYIDFLQIMLDEEAIAELVTGDVLMLLNDLSSKTVEYKSWEYDENTFEETQVTKTKQELLPDFTFMMGSQNEEILTKLFKLSIKHEFLSGKEGYFVSSEKFQNELPFDMYLCFKDGILFMTNSKVQLQNIINGKAENKMNRTQRKQIMKNVTSVYIDMEKITSKLLANESFSKELSELNDFKGDMKQLVSTSTYKKNKLTMDTYITIPEGEANSSTYLLNLVDKMITKSK